MNYDHLQKVHCCCFLMVKGDRLERPQPDFIKIRGSILDNNIGRSPEQQLNNFYFRTVAF